MPNNGIEERDNQNFSEQNLDLNLNARGEASVLPSDDAKVYGAFKCYFFTPKRGDIWGAFCLMFDGTDGDVLDNVFWVTRSLAGSPVDVTSHWKTLNKLIPQMGAYEKSLGDKLSALLLDALSSETRAALCQSANQPELLKSASDEIRNRFERATHCFLEFKTSFELLSVQDLANAGILVKDSAPAESDTPKTQSTEKSITLINCAPVIDPVHGKPVSELEPGDMVEVRIQGGVGAGDMIHKFLTSTNQDAVFPIDRVEKASADKTYVFLKINDELQGLISSTKDIRLRVLNIKGQKRTSISVNMDNVILFGVLAVAFVVIVLVIRYVLF